jgi:hypothetical protein
MNARCLKHFAATCILSQFLAFAALADCGTPKVMTYINHDPTEDYVSVCSWGPILLDGSGSTCATKYLVSLELSDRQWNRKGGEFVQWLTDKQMSNQYGSIRSFDVKAWGEDHYFHFSPGQYYRLKLATGPYWRDRTQLIYITEPKSEFTINGSATEVVDTFGANRDIVMNIFETPCSASKRYISIELSDQAWNRKGGEFGQWIGDAEYIRYGAPHAFNIKKWAEDHYFHFSAGQYYRVKLALAPPRGSAWVEAVRLVHVM